MARIATAHMQIAAAAARLIKLAMGPGMRAKAEVSIEPHYWGPHDYPLLIRDYTCATE
jgi:hypothetical protein